MLPHECMVNCTFLVYFYSPLLLPYFVLLVYTLNRVINGCNSTSWWSRTRNFFPNSWLHDYIVLSYVKSRNVKQLRIPTEAGYQKDCDPIASSENPIIPCGLIAWSLFNDTYRFSVKDKVLEVDKKDIAWRSDKEYKFGSQVYPKNFQSGGIMSIGGGKLDESLPVSIHLFPFTSIITH